MSWGYHLRSKPWPCFFLFFFLSFFLKISNHCFATVWSPEVMQSRIPCIYAPNKLQRKDYPVSPEQTLGSDAARRGVQESIFGVYWFLLIKKNELYRFYIPFLANGVLCWNLTANGRKVKAMAISVWILRWSKEGKSRQQHYIFIRYERLNLSLH